MGKAQADTVAEPRGLDALFDLQRLPVLRSSLCGMVSSYNRHSWNGDDQPEFVRIEGAERRAKGLVFYSWAEGERVDDLFVEANCTAGAWRHVAVTWSLAADGNLTKCVYLDGVLAERRVVDRWRPAEHRAHIPRESDDRLFLGSQVGAFWLDGALADVYLYDRALTEAEVASVKSGHDAPRQGVVLHLPLSASAEPEATSLEALPPSGGALQPGPDGRGMAFGEGQSRGFRTRGKLGPAHGSFAAWVNPAKLIDGRFQHLFCLGADSLGLYLASGLTGGEGVLAELPGPGCISRVWLGGGPNRTLHFYFDGEEQPRVSLRFSGAHGEPDCGAAGWLPLTSGGGDLCYPPMMATGVANAAYLETGICYMPMPFRKSCKITLEPAGSKYLQIYYHLYPPGTEVQTFDPKGLDGGALAGCRAGRERWSRPAPCDAQGAATVQELGQSLQLAPGRSAEVCRLAGAGRITGLWARLPEELRTEEVLRGLILRITWDSEPQAAVETALGPFFNDAWGTPSRGTPVPLSPDIRGAVPAQDQWQQWSFGLPDEYRNLLLGYTRDGGYYCYFPMPFATGARVEVENTAARPVSLEMRLRHEAWAAMPTNLGRFHARYHRENPTQGLEDPRQFRVDFTGAHNYVILDAIGRGHYVGSSLFFRQARPLKPEVEALCGAICEGNEMVFVDDDPALTMIGTGSEDYLNQNYWVHDHIYPYDGNRKSYDAGYRLHLGDCIPFRRHIRMTIEHGAGNAHFMDYSSVAYWYQEPGAAPIATH